ncbi:MAG: response regulator [Desulfobacterales bacterium]|nr:response regulator [Desulfobacterales bacterium]
MVKVILIVDDSPIARKMLKNSIIKYKEFDIIEAVNGQDGVDKYTANKPDLTFMDLTMPVMNGYEALQKIKEIDKDSLVIVLTADIQPKSLASVMALGAFTVIKKPAKPESIQTIIEKAELKLKAMRG